MADYFGTLKDVGRYQWSCILLYGVSAATAIIANTLILLIAPRIDFYCALNTPEFLNLTIDEKLVSTKDHCWISTNDSSGTVNYTKCQHFGYDKRLFSYTLTERFDLVCDRAWIIPFSKTLFMAGFLVGGVSAGALADRFGRRIVLVSAGFLCTIWHILCAFAPKIELFLFGRFLLAICVIAFFNSGLILHTELMRMDQRKVPRAVTSFSIGIVGIILSGLAIVVDDYRYIQVLLASISLVSSIAIFFHIPESPRWLCAQKRHSEARIIIEKLTKFNGWKSDKMDYLLNINSDGIKATLLDLYRTPLIRKRTFIIGTQWFCHILVFYALLYNMDKFWPDVRVSMMISGSIEIVTLLIPLVTIDRFGRQFMSTFFLISCGICCLCMAPFNKGSIWLLIFAIVGKLLAVNQFFIGTIFTQELYPTNLRTQGFGMASTVGRIAGMTAPQVTLLDQFWPKTSVIIMGAMAIFAGLLVIALPDTTNAELPTTLDEGENFLKDHKYKLQLAFLMRKNSQNNQDADNSKLCNKTNTENSVN